MRWKRPPHVDTRGETIIIATFAHTTRKVACAGTTRAKTVRIDVDRLTERGEAFIHTYAPEELHLEDEETRLVSGATVAGRASRKGERVRLKGEVKAEIEARCDRCLRPVNVPVLVEFDAEYVPSAHEAATEELAELQAEDMTASIYEGDSVNVDELVREQLLLARPMRLLCREDCKGLCPHCGTDLNRETCSCGRQEIDPRWAALADLKKSDK